MRAERLALYPRPNCAHAALATRHITAAATTTGSFMGRSVQPDPQAVGSEAAACSPSSATATSRILNFWTLPVTVVGNSSTNFQYAGILNVAILPRQNAASSS